MKKRAYIKFYYKFDKNVTETYKIFPQTFSLFDVMASGSLS